MGRLGAQVRGGPLAAGGSASEVCSWGQQHSPWVLAGVGGEEAGGRGTALNSGSIPEVNEKPSGRLWPWGQTHPQT